MTQLTGRRVLIAADAGAETGLGHLKRCVSLAEALAGRGFSVTFVVEQDSVAADVVRTHGFAYVDWGPGLFLPQSLARLRHLAATREYSVVVADADGPRLSALGVLTAGTVPVIVIDDNGVCPSGAWAIVNGNVHSERLHYPCVPPERCLRGPRFSLLPMARRPPRHLQYESPLRLLVTLGGGDGGGLWPGLLSAMAAQAEVWRCAVVLGPFAGDVHDVKVACGRLPSHVTVYRELPRLTEVIDEADLVVSAAGQTLYELAAAGCPGVAIPVAANQLPQLAEFERRGTVIGIHEMDSRAVPGSVLRAVAGLAEDPDRMRSMAQAGPALVDGQGARRVAEAIEDWLDADIRGNA